jgi:hypothetical protein
MNHGWDGVSTSQVSEHLPHLMFFYGALAVPRILRILGLSSTPTLNPARICGYRIREVGSLPRSC